MEYNFVASGYFGNSLIYSFVFIVHKYNTLLL
jgi:hypothetical protein